MSSSRSGIAFVDTPLVNSVTRGPPAALNMVLGWGATSQCQLYLGKESMNFGGELYVSVIKTKKSSAQIPKRWRSRSLLPVLRSHKRQGLGMGCSQGQASPIPSTSSLAHTEATGSTSPSFVGKGVCMWEELFPLIYEKCPMLSVSI